MPKQNAHVDRGAGHHPFRPGPRPSFSEPLLPGISSPYDLRKTRTKYFDSLLRSRLARRCQGKARYYEFWNEQNGSGWHVDVINGKPRDNRADRYVPWLYHCYKAIKAVDPEAQVAMGGLDDLEGLFRAGLAWGWAVTIEHRHLYVHQDHVEGVTLVSSGQGLVNGNPAVLGGRHRRKLPTSAHRRESMRR